MIPRVNHHRPRLARISLVLSALVACVAAAGCAAPEPRNPETTPATSAVAHTTPGMVQWCPQPTQCTTITPQSSAQASSTADISTKQVLTISKDLITGVGDYIAGGTANPQMMWKFDSDVVQTLLDTFFFSPSTSTAAQFQTVEADINCVSDAVGCIAQGLDWEVQEVAWSNDEVTPVDDALEDIPPGGPGFVTGSDADWGSQNGTAASGQLDMFERTYVPSSTDGDGQWKRIISNSAPVQVGPDNVFDWQAGFTRFMSLIPKRLMIMGYLDGSFPTDGSRVNELEGYRQTLQQQLAQMVGGLRCGTADDFQIYECQEGGEPNYNETYDHTAIACADVNTGISQETSYVIPNYQSCAPDGCDSSACADYVNCSDWYETNYNPSCISNVTNQSLVAYWQDQMWRQTRLQLPVFEVNSMIDGLRRFTHPWVPDLTQGAGRIPVAGNTSLCLDVVGGNPTPGTPVQIWDCNGTGAQQWAYNRHAETITNTAFGTCLTVQQSSAPLSAGTTVESDTCISPTPPEQQWTYAPDTGVIRSALGTVLDIKWNNQVAGTQVWVWDENDGPAQQWYADRSTSYCSSLCNPECQADCAGDGQGTGSCVGGCMGYCMGQCMNVETP